ncbi:MULTISPECIES: NADH:ubiquinone reductase (Na(+)-transporting) subunit C [unclassified Alistipes]|uniref:NADH:ubiquinone reductase (Na(+)-transporting) subunit C n=1 Tax=unclassified Alistipes TaxID=2608932 RepID=UPI0007A8B194|nr:MULTISPECIES: NADH:ubiquinone reductase (Na(+)-transporting) subunit C [unclassified Alistipes]CVI68983.1 Na(+)-translocating NADH-quinone reductase subunit C [Alistipes sp. CHKCI003]
MATKKFVCNVCGYVHEGDAAPETCPVCKAPASEFAQVKKKGLFSDRNGNPYIIMYSTVMVVLVAVLLAVASLSLQKRQYANELNEKKQSILQSLFAADAAAEGLSAAEYIDRKGVDYDSFIEDAVLDAEGRPIEGEDVFELLKDLGGAFDDGKYPVFEAGDGRVVIPVTGSGLWGPIWGYVALASDMNTVAGIVMAHKGETPGLGAEIATPQYQAHFIGKKIFAGDEFVSVKLRKGGATEANIEHEVDAVSGGTKTSDGVTNMLYNSLSNYLPFLEARRAAAGNEAAAPAANEVSNEENVANNE